MGAERKGVVQLGRMGERHSAGVEVEVSWIRRSRLREEMGAERKGVVQLGRMAKSVPFCRRGCGGKLDRR